MTDEQVANIKMAIKRLPKRLGVGRTWKDNGKPHCAKGYMVSYVGSHADLADEVFSQKYGLNTYNLDEIMWLNDNQPPATRRSSIINYLEQRIAKYANRTQ